MAGYTTNPGLSNSIAGFGKSLFGDPSTKIKAAQLRAQAGKYNQERLKVIQDMEIAAAKEAQRIKDQEAMEQSVKSLGEILARRPGDVQAIVEGQRPTPDMVGPMPAVEDKWTKDEINRDLSGVLAGLTRFDGMNTRANRALQDAFALQAPDWRSRQSALGNATGSNLNSLDQDAEIARLKDERANHHAMALDAQKNAHAVNLARVNAGLKPIAPDKILPQPLQEVTGVSQEQATGVGDAISARDSQEVIDQNAAKPKTGNVKPQIYFYQGPDGKMVQGLTHDGGLTDVHTGAKLPPGTQVTTKTVEGTAEEVGAPQLGLESKSNRDKAAQQRVKLQSLSDGLTRVKEIITSDPSRVGWRGNLIRFSQSMIDSFGTSAEDLIENIANDGRLSPELRDNMLAEFDRDSASLESRYTLLAYLAAEAVAGQTGRALSDNDFKKFRAALGDPTSWTRGPQDALSHLEMFEEALKSSGVQLDNLGVPPIPGQGGGQQGPVGNNPQVEAILKRTLGPATGGS